MIHAGLRVTARNLALTLTCAVALAGCLDQPVASVAPTPARTPEPTPVRTVVEVGTTVWYAGLVIHVDRVTAELDARGGPVEVAIRVDNPGTDLGELDAGLAVVVGGQRYAPTRDSHVPIIAPGDTVDAVLTFELQAIDSITAATFEVGDAPEHVAVVPLGPAGGDPIAYEPIALDVAGTGQANNLRLRLRTLELRWDLPDWAQELDADLAALTVTYDATYTGTFSGGFAFTAENVALRLPDGTVFESRRDGHSQSVELIAAGKTKKDLLSRFEIPYGVTGDLALLVRAAGITKAIPFTIGG